MPIVLFSGSVGSLMMTLAAPSLAMHQTVSYLFFFKVMSGPFYILRIYRMKNQEH